jgi:hypothetical protein
MPPPLSVILALPWDLKRGEIRDGIRCVKRTRTRMALRIEPASADWGEAAGEAIYIKRYLNPYLRRRLGSLLRISKARSEAKATEGARRRHLKTPEILGHWTTWRASYLATRELSNLTPFGEALACLEGDARTRLWTLAGRYSRLMSERGVWHPDFFQDHLCLVMSPAEASAKDWPDEELPQAFALLDLDGVRLRRPTLRQRALSAAQMLKSCSTELGNEADRLAYIRANFGERLNGDLREPLEMIRKLAKAREMETGLGDGNGSSTR